DVCTFALDDKAVPRGLAVDAGGPAPKDPPPSDAFKLGKAKQKATAGTPKLTVKTPGPGLLDPRYSEPREVVHQFGKTRGGTRKLKVKPKFNLKQRLNRTGKGKAQLFVTYIPDGGCANTKRKTVKLVKR